MRTHNLSQKVYTLLNEAKLDLEHKSFNKAASAAYFAARMALEDFLAFLKTPIPRRDDKLVHVLVNLGHVDAAQILEELYILRKKADYDRSEVTQRDAERALSLATQFVSSVESFHTKW
ncbi:hypothetical protein B9Q01_07490 [Candidatus Marsarchaeota G1 archaeon OSP_D]|uniref:HEPN domain-containing protein n=2 Tax=Candidatus Marsarchaeota group 1 TaxID=2203770 RepID=A0A2R6A826_9ARCH|nr:MAG: hypothetical protein B9Q01_07490 [Candidatus Marsarchaeota G1 archaeon OSP_D]PSN89060.1 MAG: hypothetical protein B9Q00_03130 [Candidatus Marsarchaeota G1 archaeon OSP_C]